MDLNIFCHHIGILTDNPDKLKKFYTEYLDFEEGETKPLSAELMDQIFQIPFPCTLTKLKCGSAVLEIFSPTDVHLRKRDFASVGYNHWGMAVGNKQQFLRSLKAKNVPVMEIEQAGRLIHFIKDPEGNLIEIYERKG